MISATMAEIQSWPTVWLLPGDLFPRGCWEIETQGSQKRYEDAGDEEVDDVEEDLLFQKESERHIRVRLRAAAVESRSSQQACRASHSPSSAEVGEVSTVQGIEYVHLIAIVGPGAKGPGCTADYQREVR